MGCRLAIMLLMVAGLGAADYVLEGEPADAVIAAVEAEVKAAWPELIAADHASYALQVRDDAMACVYPQTCAAYGVVADEGFTIDHASITAEITDVVVDPDYIDLRKITVSADGIEHQTGRYGVFVHFKYTCVFSWKATRGDEIRDYRSATPHRLETHHQLFPMAAVRRVFALEAFKDKQTLLISGDLFRRPEE